jgi:hypothetical protein
MPKARSINSVPSPRRQPGERDRGRGVRNTLKGLPSPGFRTNGNCCLIVTTGFRV